LFITRFLGSTEKINRTIGSRLETKITDLERVARMKLVSYELMTGLIIEESNTDERAQ